MVAACLPADAEHIAVLSLSLAATGYFHCRCSLSPSITSMCRVANFRFAFHVCLVNATYRFRTVTARCAGSCKHREQHTIHQTHNKKYETGNKTEKQ